MTDEREFFAENFDEFWKDMDAFVRRLRREYRARPWDAVAKKRWQRFRDTRRMLVPQPKKERGKK
jgi:predicted DCC family thiol-disulfide oxidoreductase YuxK